MHRVDFKTGSLSDLGDSFDLFIKGIPIENIECSSFEVNSAHVLKYNFFVYKYFFKIVEVLENSDHALQKRLRVFFDSSNLERTARGVTKKSEKICS